MMAVAVGIDIAIVIVVVIAIKTIFLFPILLFACGSFCDVKIRAFDFEYFFEVESIEELDPPVHKGQSEYFPVGNEVFKFDLFAHIEDNVFRFQGIYFQAILPDIVVGVGETFSVMFGSVVLVFASS